MTPANRRLQDRIEILVTKALATHDADELEQVIQDLREALHEHAKRLREALETTAALVGDGQGSPIPTQHRRDQDPANFAGK